jgi:hypothetical protein
VTWDVKRVTKQQSANFILALPQSVCYNKPKLLKERILDENISS